jgi:predicted permease
MSVWKEIANRLSYLAFRSRFDTELDSEIQFHIETRADELAQTGLTRAAALAQARREFGSGARAREETRAAWQLRWVEDLAADLRYAARAFRRNPAFALTAIACLALGIGANTTIFSLAEEVLFSQPSVRDAQTLAHIEIGGNSHVYMRDYRFLRDAHIFDGLAGENEETEVNWLHGDRTDRLHSVRVTDDFFDVTGIPVAMGRPIQTGESDTVVVSRSFWRERLGADPDVIGRNIVFDGKPYRIAGVLPAGHRTVIGFGFAPDLYLPVAGEKNIVALYARLPREMTRLIARERLKTACQEMDRVFGGGDYPRANQIEVDPISGIDYLRNRNVMPIIAFFAMLMIVVGLVLLVACANVASLLLARASSRSHELAIRLSIGAGHGRIIRQLLAESLLLALCGTGVGLLLNIGCTSLLSRIRFPLPVPVQFTIQPDWPLLAYSIAVALASCVAAGLMPAMKGTRGGISLALKQGERQVAHGRWTLRDALVVCQLSVSIVLLSAGFLFLRNLLHASTASPGFDISHTIWAHMRLVPEGYAQPEKTRALVAEGLSRLRTLPGVEGSTVARVVPLNDNMTTGTGLRTDLSPNPIHVTFKNNYVGPDYFRIMQIPILAGREFLESDRRGAPKVAILNENMARRLFGNTNPIGHTVRYDHGDPITIVGIAKNSKYFTLGEENTSAYYEPYAQLEGFRADLHFLVRAAGAPEALVPAVQAALAPLDTTAALEVKPMSKAMTFALLPSRIGAAILGAVGLLGLGLAAIGLYGVLLYSVSRRTREIGLRMALGASPSGILAMVLRQSAALTFAGIVIGLAFAVFAMRPLAMFLIPEVHPADAGNFIAVGAALAFVALIATVSPALRALRIDPVSALRHE